MRQTTKAILTGAVILVAALGGMAAYNNPNYSPKVVRVDLTALETNVTVADGDTRTMWTFNGTVPGPVVHVNQGEIVEFTLTNPTTNRYSHSVDFHAAKVAWDKGYRTVPPGGVLLYRFEAKYPGVFMYHCGSSPVLQHIAMGMYGMIVVHPRNVLPPAREYYITQSEIYDIGLNNPANTTDDDITKAKIADPRYVVFDGYALKYLLDPLEARVGEDIRMYVLNAGPTLNSAFHVIGTVFDRVYIDGNPFNLQKGLQTVDLPPSGGAIVEFSFDESGNNPFVTHAFAWASRGAVGLFNVTGVSKAGPTEPPTQLTIIHIPRGATSKTTDAYGPSAVVVKIGVNNTIAWLNGDTDPHTATAPRPSGSSPAPFDTDNINPGQQSRAITLTVAGTYLYYCKWHPNMLGELMVLPADSHA